jgi:hypothetical protein
VRSSIEKDTGAFSLGVSLENKLSFRGEFCNLFRMKGCDTLPLLYDKASRRWSVMAVRSGAP